MPSNCVLTSRWSLYRICRNFELWPLSGESSFDRKRWGSRVLRRWQGLSRALVQTSSLCSLKWTPSHTATDRIYGQNIKKKLHCHPDCVIHNLNSQKVNHFCPRNHTIMKRRHGVLSHGRADIVESSVLTLSPCYNQRKLSQCFHL